VEFFPWQVFLSQKKINGETVVKQAIHTQQATEAIGPYSQAIRVGQMLFFSGQIPLDPKTMNLVEGGIKAQVVRVFENLIAVAAAANVKLDAIAKLTVYLTDMTHLPVVNEVMAGYFTPPYPARTSIAVVALPKGALVEIDAFMMV
jgi:reactive intermediate/imine deaminase